jgi:hypothetical protein
MQLVLWRIMIGSEKPCKLYFHISIVRANKRQVNDYFSGDDFTGFGEQECNFNRKCVQ